MSYYQMLFAAVMLLLTSACSTTPAQNTEPSDPFETVNRASWRFTWDYADKYALKPVSEAYTSYTPDTLRTGLLNMAENLNEPSTIVNHLLQAKFSKAAQSTGRFLLNSTIGLLGFFDPAKDLGWVRHEEEFGEVLGSYGVDDGPYVVLPVLGPSSVREEVGDFVDNNYWPIALLDFWPNVIRFAVLGLEQRAIIAEQETLINESIDDYEFVKNAYFQRVQFRLHDGNPPVVVDEEEEEDLDAYLDELE